MERGKKIVYYTSFLTPIGRIFLAASEKGICRVSWGYSAEEFLEKYKLQGIRYKDIVRTDADFTPVKNDILKYLSGRPVSFKRYALDLSGTDFQRKVWRKLSEIPYGTVLTYKQLAKKVGVPRGCRAVGSACGANEVPIIIPCHRVTASGGGIGGFSGGLGLKSKLLRLEGIKVDDDVQ